ncbi:MAG: sigma-E processing peptidase SpoIIGA [Clostridia bacterium]|nr:sigma-E processing peptidase SpoIIGA [Clostridia bacterium]
MKTLYIDVYFLINFTVDMLSLYFAASLAKVNSTAQRLIISSVIGSLFACFTALYELKGILFFAALILSSLLIVFIFCKETTAVKRIKLYGAFLVFETFIGGFVSFIYGLFDRYFYKFFSESSSGAENRKILSLSLIILLSYGILRLLFLMFFGSKNEENAILTVALFGKEVTISALVDSGNLLTDPLNNSPVLLIKKKAAEALIGKDSPVETTDPKLKSRIRLIPAKGVGCKRIFVGIRCDYIKVNKGKEKYENITIALDEEEGNFGGYMALMPASLTD